MTEKQIQAIIAEWDDDSERADFMARLRELELLDVQLACILHLLDESCGLCFAVIGEGKSCRDCFDSSLWY